MAEDRLFNMGSKDTSAVLLTLLASAQYEYIVQSELIPSLSDIGLSNAVLTKNTTETGIKWLTAYYNHGVLPDGSDNGSIGKTDPNSPGIKDEEDPKILGQKIAIWDKIKSDVDRWGASIQPLGNIVNSSLQTTTNALEVSQQSREYVFDFLEQLEGLVGGWRGK